MKNISFFQRFDNFVREKQLYATDNKILLAISGGADSVVLAHLLKQQQQTFALAHCNFKLRGKESDDDGKFVEKYAAQLQVPFFTISFETKKIAEERKLSIQMTARELRYEWLKALMYNEGFELLATAHHLNDSMETLLLNLTKGCGIRGLHGILPKNRENRIVRPLMFAGKKEILDYAAEFGLEYREDSSNASDKYSRNLIRNKVIPVLESLNPSLEQRFAENLMNFQDTEQLFDFALNIIGKEIREQCAADEILKIDALRLIKVPAPKTVLFELLFPYGFNADQCAQIFEQCLAKESAIYESEHFILFRNYQKLILKEKSVQTADRELLIDRLPETPTEIITRKGQTFKFEIIAAEQFNIGNAEKNTAYFDAEKLQLPVFVRSWKESDSFCPFGMSGKIKKLSSLFKDEKIPQSQRSSVPLLISDGKIIWAAGIRASNSFTVKEDTGIILKISFNGNNK